MEASVDNKYQGISLIVMSMGAFAIADVFIKMSAGAMSPAHTTFYLMGGGLIVFSLLAKVQRHTLLDKRAFAPVLLVRYLAEIVGVFAMVMALASVPISTVGAILQTTPLLVTAGAVLFLGERVFWTQWVAIAVGFIGVWLIVQPGSEGFQVTVLWAVLGMAGHSVRDLVTRLTPSGMATSSLATYTMAAAVPFTILWCLLTEESLLPVQTNWGIVLAMIGCGAVGYILLISSIRMVEISVVAPFRYTRLLFLLVLGFIVFGERPSISTLTGATLIIVSRIYTIWSSSR